MVCTSFCSCQASEACKNEQTATSLADSEDEADCEWYTIVSTSLIGHWLDFSPMLNEQNNTALIEQFTIWTHCQGVIN